MRRKPYLWQLFVLFFCLTVVFCAGVYSHAKESGGPTIRAEVTGQKTGKHQIRAEKTSTVIETLQYRNFVPGLKYTVCGRLAEWGSGSILKNSGREVTNRISFTPRTSNGTVKIPFTFDSRQFAGKEVILLEDILCGETKILSVCSTQDQARTFLILKDS